MLNAERTQMRFAKESYFESMQGTGFYLYGREMKDLREDEIFKFEKQKAKTIKSKDEYISCFDKYNMSVEMISTTYQPTLNKIQ